MTQFEIEAFLSVVRCGSISRAADELYITQPALSRRLSSLERELGYPLIEREKGQRVIRLTSQGRRFLPCAVHFLDLYREASNLQIKGEKPILRVGTIGSVSVCVIEEILGTLSLENNPYHLEIHQIHSVDAYFSIAENRVDIAFVDSLDREKLNRSRMEAEPAFMEPFSFIGGEMYCGKEIIHPSELNPRAEIRLPWNHSFDVWHRHWFDESVFPRIRIDHVAPLGSLLHGDSFAVVPLPLAVLLERQGAVRCKMEEEPEADVIFYAHASELGEERSRCAKHFLSMMKQHIARYATMQWLL